MPNTPDDITNRCTNCPRLLTTSEQGHHACHPCQDRAATQLRALPALYGHLGDALIPGTTSAGTGPVTGATKTPPTPAVLQPLSLRGPGGIVSQLLGIEQRWRIQLDWEPLPFRGSYDQTLPGCVTMLVNNLPWACADYELVADDLRLVNSLHRQAEGAVSGVWEQRVPVGCCPARVDDGPTCGEPLRVSPWAAEIRCDGCGERWPRSEWLRLGATMRGLPTAAFKAA